MAAAANCPWAVADDPTSRPGDSGGPLVAASGQVIGVDTSADGRHGYAIWWWTPCPTPTPSRSLLSVGPTRQPDRPTSSPPTSTQKVGGYSALICNSAPPLAHSVNRSPVPADVPCCRTSSEALIDEHHRRRPSVHPRSRAHRQALRGARPADTRRVALDGRGHWSRRLGPVEGPTGAKQRQRPAGVGSDRGRSSVTRRVLCVIALTA